MTYEIIVLT